MNNDCNNINGFKWSYWMNIAIDTYKLKLAIVSNARSNTERKIEVSNDIDVQLWHKTCLLPFLKYFIFLDKLWQI